MSATAPPDLDKWRTLMYDGVSVTTVPRAYGSFRGGTEVMRRLKQVYGVAFARQFLSDGGGECATEHDAVAAAQSAQWQAESEKARAATVAAQDMYRVLEITADASEAQVTKAYKLMALRVHPDRAGSDAEAAATATSAFQRVQAAYDTLREPASRRAHDEALRRAGRTDADSSPWCDLHRRRLSGAGLRLAAARRRRGGTIGTAARAAAAATAQAAAR